MGRAESRKGSRVGGDVYLHHVYVNVNVKLAEAFPGGAGPPGVRYFRSASVVMMRLTMP
jgi:hypothetical protein